MPYRNIQRIGAFIIILCFHILPNSGTISADTIILKDGQTFENVKTSLRQDHVLVQDEKGKIEKIDLTLVEKILVSEIKKSEVVQEEKKEYINIKKFYFSLNGSSWNTKVSEGINFNRGYSLTDVRTNVVNIDPYFERRYRKRSNSFFKRRISSHQIELWFFTWTGTKLLFFSGSTYLSFGRNEYIHCSKYNSGISNSFFYFLRFVSDQSIGRKIYPE